MTTHRRRPLLGLAVLTLLAIGLVSVGELVGQPSRQKTPNRPKPRFSRELRSVFFDDARQIGSPEYLTEPVPGSTSPSTKPADKPPVNPATVAAKPQATNPPTTNLPANTVAADNPAMERPRPADPGPGTGFPGFGGGQSGLAGGAQPKALGIGVGGTGEWSRLIAPSILENEIKGLVTQAKLSTRASGRFKSRGYKKTRREFSMLAVYFEIVNQFDADIRWRDEAQAISYQTAQVAQSLKEGTDATFNKAADHTEKLSNLLNATKLNLRAPSNSSPWADLAGLSLIMQRMEQASASKLELWLGSESEFAANQEDVLHEAQILAVLGKVIQDASYLDDADYRKLAQTLTDESAKMAQAAEQGAFGNAKQAFAAVSKSCATCHDSYR